MRGCAHVQETPENGEDVARLRVELANAIVKYLLVNSLG